MRICIPVFYARFFFTILTAFAFLFISHTAVHATPLPVASKSHHGVSSFDILLQSGKLLDDLLQLNDKGTILEGLDREGIANGFFDSGDKKQHDKGSDKYEKQFDGGKSNYRGS
ncbi:hypothetical protein BDF20DRAFT_894253 [Mycotypha africana]|uniref:uncharacterized protein n=1 Tax=Mycotypha africana TaxID=64632 RepID=UPI0022FFC9A5|nr:uncharacterized protein BDF20DRAFT_894253 [Mycotypha africana]KAI8969293.1 hypothetical protein BDF20DRAFT_894253 [Mycotypha africana]